MRNALFLCGYQQPTRRALRDVMEQRGLIDLLRAGNALAAAGIRLVIAVPFLRHESMRIRLLAETRRLCPALDVSLQDEVDAVSVFLENDVFVFPYRADHAVFVPTSLLEAMSVGIPVVAADHLMYRALTIGASGPRCGLHRIGDSDDLASQLLEMGSSYDVAVERAAQSAICVRAEWTIEHSANQLIAALNRQSA